MAKRRQELIGESLARVTEVARRHVVKSVDIGRTDRERLVSAGYLQPVMKGWYLLGTPEAEAGDTTLWFSTYWAFLTAYLEDRFGGSYCLGADPSLRLHVGASAVPGQVAVIAARGGRTVVSLPHGCTVITYEDPDNLPDSEEVVRLGEEGIRGMSLPMALARVSPSYFNRSSGQADIALRLVPAASDLARTLVKGAYATAADRLIGAYRALGDAATANEIEAEMDAAGYRVKPENPFLPTYDSPFTERRIVSPQAARVRSLWSSMRETVRAHFPPPPGLPKRPDDYLQSIADHHTEDAYNSLSIEGYRVTPKRIEQLRSGRPASPEGPPTPSDMAVRGYERASGRVEACIRAILDGEDPGLTLAEYLHDWHRALFSPQVEAGHLRDHDLIGYRRQPVYIKSSLHVPPPWPAVPDCMAAFLDLLQGEDHAAVRAVLGHFVFVYIHPYADGNGRLARFLMNAMLASGGYPWTIVPVSRRQPYMEALEEASVRENIQPFTEFLAGLIPA